MLDRLAVAQPERQPERRTVKRWVVDCEARLKLAGGDRTGRLVDLSSAGARFECDHPPAAGISSFLAWDGQEYFCRVIWANRTACGLRFERPLPLAVVEATAQMMEDAGPVADLGRIPMAEKRSRRLRLVSGD